ncbi:hypothetical protein B4U80_13266 [Leptotrombidium deliense]|uniref:Uncharacterized protein n=1 Tax=Leptotrombidium deliense TaxID=299467 RepID=A0A443S9C9_9ACAR|nr:hypothetical protein B4U80_13266 [Leptotrombidium deliense]
MKMENATIAALSCPNNFAAGVNPNEKELLDSFESWVKEKFPKNKDGNEKMLTLVCRCMPQASTEFLLFASKALFLEKLLLETLKNENGKRHETIMKLLQSVQKIAMNEWKEAELSAIEKTAVEIVNSGKHLVNADFEKRFLPKLISYLKALAEIEEQKQQGCLPSFPEVLTLRHCSSSAEMLIELCEAGMGLELSIENRCDSIIQRMLKTVIKMSLIGNDLAKFEEANDCINHVVNAVKRNRNCTWQKALDETVQLYTCEQSSFTALEKLVDVDAMQQGKVVKKYLKMLKFVVRAMHDYNELSNERVVRIQ